jgi:hypothetical protein
VSSFKDITGLRFGKWTAIKPIKSNATGYFWECICDCGTKREVVGSSLRQGKSKSCGCIITQDSKPKIDLTGKRIGRWLVIEPIKKYIESSSQHMWYWRCICDCGKLKEVSGSHLRNGNTKSCGCIWRLNAKKGREANLKEGTHLGVIASKVTRSNSGVKGVYLTRFGTFHTKITFKGKVYELGTYKTIEEATEARKTAERKLYMPILGKYNKNDSEEWQ